MTGYWESIAIPILIDAIAVQGLFLVVSSGRLSIGHAAFFGIGAYAAAVISIQDYPSWLSIATGAVVAGLTGGVFALLAGRLTHWFFAVATLAFSMMLSGVVSNLEDLGGATGLYGVPLDVDLTVVAIVLCAVVALNIAIEHSPFGRCLRAVRSSELAAQALGINPGLIHFLAFALGCGIAGLAGGLWAHYLGVIKPSEFSLDRSLFFLVYLAIGGIDSWAGALLGVFILGALPEVLRFSQGYRLALFGLLLAVVMVLRPNGLIPRFRFKGRNRTA